MSGPEENRTCGTWMPVAGSRCALPPGHKRERHLSAEAVAAQRKRGAGMTTDLGTPTGTYRLFVSIPPYLRDWLVRSAAANAQLTSGTMTAEVVRQLGLARKYETAIRDAERSPMRFRQNNGRG